MSYFQWEDVDLNAGNIVTGTLTSVDHAKQTGNVQDIGDDIPIHFHCKHEGTNNDGTSWENAYPDGEDAQGSTAFASDDEVLVMYRRANNEDPVIVGHANEVKSCSGYIVLFHCGSHRLVAWDMLNHKFPEIPKSAFNEETQEHEYDGEYFQDSDWPLGNLLRIQKWLADSPKPTQEQLVKGESVNPPPVGTMDDISDSVDDGSGFATITSHNEWRASGLWLRSNQYPWPPAPTDANQFARTWETLYGSTIHTIGGDAEENRRIYEPAGKSSKYQKRYDHDTKNVEVDEWSGSRWTFQNPAEGHVDFIRHIVREGSEAFTLFHGEWISYVTSPWGYDNHRGYDETYFFNASYAIDSIGGKAVFECQEVEESWEFAWDCVADDPYIATWQQICTPEFPAPTPMGKFWDMDNPKRAHLVQSDNISCETKEPDGSSFVEQRIYGYVLDEGSQFDPAAIVQGTGQFHVSDDNPDEEFMVIWFIRERTEVLPNCMDFEIFVAMDHGGGVAQGSAKNLTPELDGALTDALDEMLIAETQTGEKWRNNPWLEVRDGAIISEEDL
jgi:hypothetical protein